MPKAFRHTRNEHQRKFDIVIDSDDTDVAINMTNKPVIMLTFKEAVILQNVLSEWLVQV